MTNNGKNKEKTMNCPYLNIDYNFTEIITNGWGFEEIGYRILGSYVIPAHKPSRIINHKRLSRRIGSQNRYWAIFYCDQEASTMKGHLDGVYISKKWEKESQKTIKEFGGNIKKLSSHELMPEQFKNYDFMDIAQSPFNDAAKHDDEIIKQEGYERMPWLCLPKEVQEKYITYEEAMSRNPIKYKILNKVVLDTFNLDKEKLIKYLIDIPLNWQTMDLWGMGERNFVSRIMYDGNNTSRKAKSFQMKEAKYSNWLKTFKLTEKGVNGCLKHSLEEDLIRETKNNIAMTIKGLAYMSQYFNHSRN